MCMFSSASLAKTDAEKAVIENNTRFVNHVGLPFGITHSEWIYSQKTKKAYLVEIAARGGGVYLSSHITPMASGIDTNELLLEYLINGAHINIPELVLSNNVAGWLCFSLHPGRIISIEGKDHLNSISGVRNAFLDNVNIGDKIPEIKDDTGKYGPILFQGSSREECYDTISNVKNTLKIITESGGKKHGIVW